MVLPEANKNVYLSARNLERTNLAIASALNTYSVLNAVNSCCYRERIESYRGNLS